MEITEEMLAAAMKKAVNAGLFPRRSYADEVATQKAVMSEILDAALAMLPCMYGMVPPPDSLGSGRRYAEWL